MSDFTWKELARAQVQDGTVILSRREEQGAPSSFMVWQEHADGSSGHHASFRRLELAQAAFDELAKGKA